jgi:hypothetical protein
MPWLQRSHLTQDVDVAKGEMLYFSPRSKTTRREHFHEGLLTSLSPEALPMLSVSVSVLKGCCTNRVLKATIFLYFVSIDQFRYIFQI